MKKVIGIVAVLVVGIVGFLGYVNFKVGEISKEVENGVNQAKNDFVEYINNQGLGIDFIVSGDMSCGKEDWIMPSVVCKTKEMKVDAKNTKETAELLNLQDFSLIFKSSIAMLMGKEGEFQISGRIGLGNSMQREILQETNRLADQVVVTKLLGWFPNAFNLSLKATKKDSKSFEISTNLELTSKILKSIFAGKVQYDELQNENISALEFVNQIFSPKQDQDWRQILLASDITVASEKETKKEMEQFVYIVSQNESLGNITLESLANMMIAGIDVISVQCRDCKEIPHFSEFISFAKNFVNVLAGQSQSTTLSFKLKKGANLNTESLQAMRDILRNGIQTTYGYQTFLEILREYDVKVSAQSAKENN